MCQASANIRSTPDWYTKVTDRDRETQEKRADVVHQDQHVYEVRTSSGNVSVVLSKEQVGANDQR